MSLSVDVEMKEESLLGAAGWELAWCCIIRLESSQHHLSNKKLLKTLLESFVREWTMVSTLSEQTKE